MLRYLLWTFIHDTKQYIFLNFLLLLNQWFKNGCFYTLKTAIISNNSGTGMNTKLPTHNCHPHDLANFFLWKNIKICMNFKETHHFLPSSQYLNFEIALMWLSRLNIMAGKVEAAVFVPEVFWYDTQWKFALTGRRQLSFCSWKLSPFTHTSF